MITLAGFSPLLLMSAAWDVDGMAYSFQGIVEPELAVLIAAEHKPAAELVIYVTGTYLEIPVSPLDILPCKEKFLHVFLLSELISIQGRHISFQLDTCRKTSQRIVYLKVIICTELVFRGLTQDFVFDIIDRVGLKACGDLALPDTDLCTCIQARHQKPGHH